MSIIPIIYPTITPQRFQVQTFDTDIADLDFAKARSL